MCFVQAANGVENSTAVVACVQLKVAGVEVDVHNVHTARFNIAQNLCSVQEVQYRSQNGLLRNATWQCCRRRYKAVVADLLYTNSQRRSYPGQHVAIQPVPQLQPAQQCHDVCSQSNAALGFRFRRPKSVTRC